MFASHLRRGLVPVIALALGFSLASFAAPAQAADPVPAAADPAPALPSTVSADALPTVQINGVVWKQVIVGNTVFAGGEFTSARPAGSAPGVNTTPRSNLLSYDIRTGVMDASFAPTFNGRVSDMAVTPDKTKLIVIGTFTQVNGVTRNRAAVFNLPSGTLSTTVVPNLNGVANSVAATNSTLYFGGYFSAINNDARIRIGAVSATTGKLLPFQVPVDNGQVQSIIVSPDGNQVVFSGNFTSVGGSSDPGYGLARVDSVTGAMLPLPVNSEFRDAGPNSGVLRLASDSTSFYGVGWTYGQGGSSEGTFQANWSDGALVTLDDCHGDTYDVAPIGDVIYTASHKHYCGNSGGFPQTDPWTFWHSTAWTKSVQGVNTGDIYGYPDHPGTPRGALLPWFPKTDVGTFTGKSQAVWTVTGNDQYVLYGGEFPKVNGTGQQGLVRYAVRSLAPNKQGPRPVAEGTVFTPTVRSYAPGEVRVNWPALWDRDDTTINYDVYRDTATNKVFSTSQTNFQWTGKPMQFIDKGLTPGSTVKYRVRGTDPSGNTHTSEWFTVKVADADQLGTYGAAVIGDGASKYYRLDETDGTVNDWSGTDDTTAGTGVTRGTTGALNNSTDTASTFDGTANGVVVSKAPIAGPNTFSQEVWFKTTSATGGKIAGFGSSATGDSGSYDRHLYMSGGRVYFGVYPGSSQTLNSAAGLNDGQWHQAVASLGDTGMALYIDGKRVGSRTDVTYGQAYTGYWRLGGDNTWSGDKYFNGSLDDYSVYPTVLTSKQVNAHWMASGRSSALPSAPADALGKSMFESDPDTYWRLNETNTTTAADSGSGNNPGTYVGNYTRGQAGVVSGNASVQLKAPVVFAGRTITAGGNITSSTPVANPTTFSQEVWIKTNTTTGGRIFGFGSSNTGATSNNYDRMLYMLNDGKVRFGVYNGNTITIDSNASLNDNAWHQVVSTFDSTGMKLYVDGKLNSTNANTAAQNYTGYWKLGGDNTWGGNSSMYFTGLVDEAAVYPRALSLADVQNHFIAGGGNVPNVKPTPAFTSTVADLKASFDGLGSTDADGQVVSYAWNFGDGAEDTGATPEHTYSTSGTYPVTLTVTDNRGATDTISHDVTVLAANAKPTAAFTSSKVDLLASFDASGSTDSDGTVETYAWNFGDSSPTDTTKSPDHEYANAGTYSVTLTVTDNRGGTDTVQHDVTVVAPNVDPTAAFTSSKVDLLASFDASGSTDSDGTVETYAWNFGDSSPTDTTKSPDHEYANAGTYTVTLTVTDNRGGTDTIQHDVTVTAPVPNVKPTAAFSSSNVDLKASLDASGSTDSDGTVDTYSWKFGDNSSGNGKLASHTYATPGTYTVELTVTDNKGATDTITHDVTVTAPSVLASDDFNRTLLTGWGTADNGGAWTVRGGDSPAKQFSVANGTGKITVPAGRTLYADLSSVSSTSTLTTAEFSVDKVIESNYVALVGRQVGNDSYVARLRFQADGQVRLYLLRNTDVAVAASYLVPNLTIVPGQKYKVSLEVKGTSPTTVSAKVWKSTDPEPATWQRSGTDTLAALQAPGRVGIFSYLPTAATNAPVAVMWEKITVANAG